MHADAHSIAQVAFGWDPLWVSTILFILTYVIIVTERVNRAIVSGLGAALMVSLGVVTQQQAVAGVDFNTLGLLTGMMVIVAITRRCGIFQYVAIWTSKMVGASPWGILLCVLAIAALRMRISSVDRKVRSADGSLLSIRIIAPASNPARRQEGKGLGIREDDRIPPQGEC